MLLVAVDAGGSSTRAVVLDGSGRCLGLGTAGSANPVSSGAETIGPTLAGVVTTALAAAAVPGHDVAGVTIAMAGASSPRLAGVTDGLAAAGVVAPYVVESDLLAMYCAGTVSPDGYGVVAGTGAAAVRVRDGMVEASADGMGWLLGDEGSGFWIGREVVRAVVADLDGRGTPTALTPLVLDAVGATDVLDLVHRLYADRPVRLARLAPLAFAVGDDPVAAGIAASAARALAHTLVAVLRPEVDGPLVLGGSVLLRQARVAATVEAAYRAAGHPGEVVTVADGTAGAAVLALRHGGVDVDPATYGRVTATLADLRARRD